MLYKLCNVDMPNNPYTGLANIVLYLANLTLCFYLFLFLYHLFWKLLIFHSLAHTDIYFLLLLQKFFSRLEYRDHYDDFLHFSD